MKENKRRINKLKVSIVIILAILFITITVFGRYIYKSFREMYLSSKEFYFTSNLLETDVAEYNFNNWNGTGTYQIKFDLYSYNDQLQKVDYDLAYNLSCTVQGSSPKAKCTINSATGPTSLDGIIYQSTHKDSITLYVTPLTTLSVGDEIEIVITAKTEEPYAKEISANYKLVVSNEYTGYTITDEVNQNYLTLHLVNPEAEEATLTIAINPAILRVDMNDDVYRIKTAETTETETGKGYVNSITFKMTAESSKNIRFYKVDSTQDYTYPNAGNPSVITVTKQ